jgi:hypothetical protein
MFTFRWRARELWVKNSYLFEASARISVRLLRNPYPPLEADPRPQLQLVKVQRLIIVASTMINIPAAISSY